ncbi:MAG: hypothetical protein ACR2MP_23140 [Streptosporangiaceae bacterium]
MESADRCLVLLVLRNIRLTADQARQLARALNGLAASLDDAGDGAARYGVLVGSTSHGHPGRHGIQPVKAVRESKASAPRCRARLPAARPLDGEENAGRGRRTAR